MEKVKSAKAVAIITTTLLVTSLVWLMNTKSVNGSLQAGLKDEKLKSESLLSEKLSLEKDILKMKDQILLLKGENIEFDKLVNATMAKLNSQQSDYNRMKKENLGLAQLKKQKQELIALQSKLENELQSLRDENSSLSSENHDLITTVASLKERNKILTDDLNRSMFSMLDQSQIQAVKGKSERLTVKAKRTKKLVADFDIPASLINLSFKVLDAKGNVLSPEAGTIISSVMPATENLLASTENNSAGNRFQKVKVNYTPSTKLKSGIYTIEVLSENLHVGSMKVRLK
jgi:hypothetical protein